MNKIMLTLLMSLMVIGLIANPAYVPQTALAELVSATWCEPCGDAYAGMDVLHNAMHSGEFLSIRYYTTSANYSSPSTEERVAYYNASAVPIAIFNGENRVNGGGAQIADGSSYTAAMLKHRFADSPIKLSITSFDAQTGAIHVRATMVSPTVSLSDAYIRFAVMEDDVTPLYTHVTREVLSQPITLSGAGNFVDFTANFTVSPTWVTANLWAAAFVQLADKTIIQAASNLPQPQYQIRAAFPFSPAIIDSANFNYISQPIWFFNTGAANDYTIKLLQDDGPADWYFNYCSEGENGQCYPGFIPNPFSLAEGEYIGYHLNLGIGAEGVSHFHFLIESPNLEPYIIPFVYNTHGTAVDDNTALQAPVILSQNSPNPFRESTTLRVFAKQPTSNTGIEIYNAKGQKVHTIRAGALKQGMTEINWDGRTSDGKRLAQGVYFSRIQDSGNSTSRKMLLID